MGKNLHILSFGELFTDKDCGFVAGAGVCCKKLNASSMESLFSEEICVNATAAFLVISGKAKVNIDKNTYNLDNEKMLFVYILRPFFITDVSCDFTCHVLFVSKEFMDDMDPSEMIYTRTKYSVALFGHPIINLQPSFSVIAHKRLDAVSYAICDTEHYYYRSMILNSVIAFYLDFSNYIERLGLVSDKSSQPRYAEYARRFLELLIKFYVKEHTTDFYASQLGISSHYLTLIIKQTTLRSPADYINELLFSEAKSLLTNSELSVKEISVRLFFSDQSSFGKFFKRNSGVSPGTYRVLTSAV